MSLAILLVGVGLILVADVTGAWLHRRSRRRRQRVAATPPVPGVGRVTDPEAIERYLTARVLVHSIDQESYRSRMASIAAAAAGQPVDDLLRRATAIGPESARLLGTLGTALPELSPATLRAAVCLAGHGAAVDDLVRMLGLTPAQALRITAATPGAADHRS